MSESKGQIPSSSYPKEFQRLLNGEQDQDNVPPQEDKENTHLIQKGQNDSTLKKSKRTNIRLFGKNETGGMIGSAAMNVVNTKKTIPEENSA
jgi:hypothetical protein